MLEELIQAKGFKRKRGSRITWIKDTADVYQVMDIQKSYNGDYFFLNLGVSLKSMGEPVPKNCSVCHIYTRANDGLGPNKGLFADMLDETKQIPYEERLRFVQSVFDGNVTRFFSMFETEPQVLAYALVPDNSLPIDSPKRWASLKEYARTRASSNQE